MARKRIKVEATPMDCIVCDCPYCEKEIIELNADLRDVTSSDIEEETEIECPFCKKIFLAIIGE
jgi:uncharacterized protein with PIN domain